LIAPALGFPPFQHTFRCLCLSLLHILLLMLHPGHYILHLAVYLRGIALIHESLVDAVELDALVVGEGLSEFELLDVLETRGHRGVLEVVIVLVFHVVDGLCLLVGGSF